MSGTSSRSRRPALYKEIFQAVCEAKGVGYDEAAVDHLIRRHYRGDVRRPFAACQPRDLVDQVIDAAAYRNEEPRLTPETVDRVARAYFVRFGDSA